MDTINSKIIRDFVEIELKRAQNNGKWLLDLGCGKRPFEDIYSKMGYRYHSADYEERANSLDYVCDAQNMPIITSSFYDVVLFTEVLEHIPNPNLALSEIGRILKAGGLIVLTVPFMHKIHEAPYDYYRYTEFGLEHMLKQNGFKITSFRRRGNILYLGISLLQDVLFSFLVALSRTFGFRNKILIRPFVLKVLWVLPLAFYRVAKRETLGENMTGINRMLKTWHLGYCIVAQKI